MGKTTKESEKDAEAEKNKPRGKYLAKLEGDKLKDPPDSFKAKVSAELGLEECLECNETARHNRRASDNANYTKLTKIMKHNQPLLAYICFHTGFKKENVVGAAILHFSSLPLPEQLEIVIKYQKTS